jgi:glycosyltransferase involved in cell wall biosynthesis
MSNKKMCVDTTMLYHSGIGTYLRNVLSHLDEKTFSIQRLSISSPIYSVRQQIEYPFLIPSCDLFWAPHYTIPLAPIRARRLLTTIHDVCHVSHVSSLNRFKKAYAKFMIEQAVKKSDHLITISQFSKSEIIKLTSIDENKISVIPLAANLNFVTSACSTQDVKKKYHLPDRYFLYVGNLAAHKNVGRLIHAWEKVQRKYPHYYLVLVGKEKILHQRIDTTRYLGQVPENDLPALYNMAQGLVMPSLYEGFGLTPLEAMSMGCPTIVSSAASLPEVCQDASLYVDPLDCQDIYEKISRVIEDHELRDALIAKGLERVQYYSWEQTAALHQGVMEKLVS